MQRREFLTVFGGAMAGGVAARRAQAQETRAARRIGMLIARNPDDAEGQAYVAAFERALNDLGWIIQGNMSIDYRWLARDAAGALTNTKELVALRPDVLVVNSSAYVRAALQAAGSIPIVMVAIADPVGQGFVRNLARPGGTLTGFGVEEASMGGKWLELLHDVAPSTTRCIATYNPQMAPASPMFLAPMQEAARRYAIEAEVVPVQSREEIERVVASAGASSGRGLVFLPDSYLYAQREFIVDLTNRYHVPSVYYHRAFAEAGGLVAFGIERIDLFRRAGIYVDMILKGTSPGELPLQMPSKFELVINLKTAKAQGIAMPESLLARADEVIE